LSLGKAKLKLAHIYFLRQESYHFWKTIFFEHCFKKSGLDLERIAVEI